LAEVRGQQLLVTVVPVVVAVQTVVQAATPTTTSPQIAHLMQLVSVAEVVVVLAEPATQVVPVLQELQVI
jgi:cytochrome c oxidase assembly factor CtaG